MTHPVRAVAIGVTPSVSARADAPLDICNALAQWAEVADVESPRVGKGRLAVSKSDLLGRLVSGEQGPSQTPCPVHEGRWSGLHFGWPGSHWRGAGGVETPADVRPQLQEWYDDGCRCFMHRGSSCTTGWQPDESCGCAE